MIEAIRKLRQAIQSLNREGRERLLAAFDTVNGHFQRLFAHLFGGGTAELQLIESEDPLEAGLEILARPPGKKPQTMTLLSGGEQALTAMALIFAVFLTNPAPICVLDEVDAPLDDHNVERFCNLMDEMAKTHRDPLRHHHPQSDHHGAHEPAVRRDHGRAGRQPAGVGRPAGGRSRCARRAEPGGVLEETPGGSVDATLKSRWRPRAHAGDAASASGSVLIGASFEARLRLAPQDEEVGARTSA